MSASELRTGTDIRIEYDEDGEGWMDPYMWWLIDCLLRYTATNAPRQGGRP